MVVLGRLDYVLEMVSRGRSVRISTGYVAKSGQNKVKLDISSDAVTVPNDARRLTTNLLHTLAAETQVCITVDRGHKHSDGRSHIDLGMQSLGAQKKELPSLHTMAPAAQP